MIKKVTGWIAIVFAILTLSIALIPGVFSFLDKHSWIITGLAGFAAAAATVYIAAFSRGTWHLFEQAREEREGKTALLQREIRGLRNRVHSTQIELEALVELTEEDAEFSPPGAVLKHIGDHLKEQNIKIEQLITEAATKSHEAMDYLLAAQQHHTVAGALVSVESVGARRFEQAASSLESAYLPLHKATGSETDPGWDPEFEERMRAADRVWILGLGRDTHDPS